MTAIPALYDKSPEPKQLETFPGTIHGTELFDAESGAELRDLLTHFMEELAAPIVKPPSTPTSSVPQAQAAPFHSGMAPFAQPNGSLIVAGTFVANSA